MCVCVHAFIYCYLLLFLFIYLFHNSGNYNWLHLKTADVNGTSSPCMCVCVCVCVYINSSGLCVFLQFSRRISLCSETAVTAAARMRRVRWRPVLWWGGAEWGGAPPAQSLETRRSPTGDRRRCCFSKQLITPASTQYRSDKYEMFLFFLHLFSFYIKQIL